MSYQDDECNGCYVYDSCNIPSVNKNGNKCPCLDCIVFAVCKIDQNSDKSCIIVSKYIDECCKLNEFN